MADKINEIISPEALAQLQELRGELDESAKSLNGLAKAAKNLDFGKVKSLSELGQWAQEYEKTLAAMTAANVNYANSLQKSVLLTQKVNTVTKEEVETYDTLQAAKLKEAQADALRQKTAKQAADEVAKATKREETALKQLNNEYELLKRAYKDAADKAKELGISFGTNSKIFKDAASNAKVMYDRLLKVEMAVGQGQRAVGQYNQAAFAMQQILRETPAFAYSFATGISAIANNIPILVDEINRMKAANAELTASGGKAVPIWKTLWQSILSPMGLLTLGIGAFTIFTARMSMHTHGMKTATDVGKKYADTLKEIDENAASASAKESANVKSLIGVAQNLSLSMNVRLKAVKELQDKYPDYLGNLRQEKILTGDLTTEVENLNKALLAKGMYEASTQKIGAAYTKIFEAEIQLTKLEEEFLRQMVEMRKKGVDPNKYGEETYKNIEGRKSPFIKQIAEAKKEIAEFQKLADKYAADAGGTLFGRDKKGKGRTEKDTTLKSESDLLQAIYDNKQKELEITRDTNKAIADDTTKEMADRLVAHENYLAAVLELARNERDRTIDLEGEKLDEIDRLKEKAKGKELANLREQQRAAMIRVNTAQMEFNDKQKEVVEKGQKETLAIVYSSNEQWIKSEEFRNEKLKELQIGLFLQDSELLKRQLDSKQITQKQYNDKMKQLRKTEGVMLLDDDIKLYETILKNDQITAEKRLEIQKKLNQAMKAKSQMSEGQPMRKSGRITDSLAMMLGIGDEEALQAFYDRTIDLVNRATDAIIAAKQRQYQAELSVLDKQKEGIQSNYDMQLALINATGKSEQDKANKISQLNAQRLTQEAIIEQKKREIAQKQAQFEKTAAIASIIQNTAVAIAGALKYGPAAPPIIALIAASGAAQLAAVSNAPLPAYKEGTDNHIGGAFIAGDGGEPELIVAPNKRPYWSNSVSTLYNEGAGTKVIPMSDIMQYTTTNTEDFSAAQLDALANRIAKSFDKTGYKIAQVIQSSKPQDNSRAIGEAMRNQFNLQGK